MNSNYGNDCEHNRQQQNNQLREFKWWLGLRWGHRVQCRDFFKGLHDCNFPQVQSGMRDKPRRCRSPQLKATRRPDYTDTESGAEKHLNKPNIADEMLIKGTRVSYARHEVIPR